MGITGALAWREVGAYAVAQTVGGCLGTFAAHGMFELPLFQLASTARTGPVLWFAEFVATFGLLVRIDVKKIGRFHQVGHRITGDRTRQSSPRGRGEGAGWSSSTSASTTPPASRSRASCRTRRPRAPSPFSRPPSRPMTASA